MLKGTVSRDFLYINHQSAASGPIIDVLDQEEWFGEKNRSKKSGETSHQISKFLPQKKPFITCLHWLSTNVLANIH